MRETIVAAEACESVAHTSFDISTGLISRAETGLKAVQRNTARPELHVAQEKGANQTLPLT